MISSDIPPRQFDVAICDIKLFLDVLRVLFNMIVKLNSNKRITLPKSATAGFGDTEFFAVEVKDDRIVLTPVPNQPANALRAKLAKIELQESDIGNAMAWARRRSQSESGRVGKSKTMATRSKRSRSIDDENPEWTREDFSRAKPAVEVLPKIVGNTTTAKMLRPKR